MGTGKHLSILKVTEQVYAEAIRAKALFPDVASPHEALGIIQEEFYEFAAEVYRFNLRKGRDSRPEMREELIQLAAVAVRAIADLDL